MATDDLLLATDDLLLATDRVSSSRMSSMSASELTSDRSFKRGSVDDGGPLGQLSVKLHSASGLKAKDMNGKSDPYVIFQFGSEAEVCSSVKGKTLTPQWEESFVISERMSAALMLTGKLSVTVMDKDAGAFHDCSTQRTTRSASASSPSAYSTGSRATSSSSHSPPRA
jgi:hypothetical protein